MTEDNMSIIESAWMTLQYQNVDISKYAEMCLPESEEMQKDTISLFFNTRVAFNCPNI